MISLEYYLVAIKEICNVVIGQIYDLYNENFFIL